jgi:hypothetical protein
MLEDLTDSIFRVTKAARSSEMSVNVWHTAWRNCGRTAESSSVWSHRESYRNTNCDWELVLVGTRALRSRSSSSTHTQQRKGYGGGSCSFMLFPLCFQYILHSRSQTWRAWNGTCICREWNPGQLIASHVTDWAYCAVAGQSFSTWSPLSVPLMRNKRRWRWTVITCNCSNCQRPFEKLTVALIQRVFENIWTCIKVRRFSSCFVLKRRPVRAANGAPRL